MADGVIRCPSVPVSDPADPDSRMRETYGVFAHARNGFNATDVPSELRALLITRHHSTGRFAWVDANALRAMSDVNNWMIFTDTINSSTGLQSATRAHNTFNYNEFYQGIHLRHGDRANASFPDGRVSSLSVNDLREIRRINLRLYAVRGKDLERISLTQ